MTQVRNLGNVVVETQRRVPPRATTQAPSRISGTLGCRWTR